MTNQTGYSIGHWLGKNWPLTALGAIGIGALVVAWRTPISVDPPKPPPLSGAPNLSETELAAIRRADELRVKCSSGLQALFADARGDMKVFPDRAYKTLDECTAHIEDPKDKAAHAKLLAEAKTKAEAEERRVATYYKAQKKRDGVSIGMTQQDVLDSSWGRPRHINRTTTARGTSEQWVYSGGYLYFEDGVLRTIQN